MVAQTSQKSPKKQGGKRKRKAKQRSSQGEHLPSGSEGSPDKVKRQKSGKNIKIKRGNKRAPPSESE